MSTQRRGGPPPDKVHQTGPDNEPEVEVRRLHPFQAVKSYSCPGCNQEIPPGTGHVVVVPIGAVDDRRHWHHACWQYRHRRRPGRSRRLG